MRDCSFNIKLFIHKLLAYLGMHLYSIDLWKSNLLLSVRLENVLTIFDGFKGTSASSLLILLKSSNSSSELWLIGFFLDLYGEVSLLIGSPFLFLSESRSCFLLLIRFEEPGGGDSLPLFKPFYLFLMFVLKSVIDDSITRFFASFLLRPSVLLP